MFNDALSVRGVSPLYELSNFTICDIDMCDSHKKLFLEKSKTDQYKEGLWIIIGATEKSNALF